MLHYYIPISEHYTAHVGHVSIYNWYKPLDRSWTCMQRQWKTTPCDTDLFGIGLKQTPMRVLAQSVKQTEKHHTGYKVQGQDSMLTSWEYLEKVDYELCL